MSEFKKELAFVFPGQGSQQIGMLSDIADAYPVVQEVFSQASDTLGYDLWSLVQSGPEEELNSTENTQPALLTAGVAMWNLFKTKTDVMPATLAGHSLGEYTALVCAEVMPLDVAVKVVQSRGKFMQQSVPAGSGSMMAIIGLDDESIVKACIDAADGEVVSAVNFNSPGQVVIAGDKAAVERAGTLCKEAGAKRALPLAVSVPSHCALMKPAAEELAGMLKEITFSKPSIAVLNNVRTEVNIEADKIKQSLIDQLSCPVQWVKTIESLHQSGVSTIVECGPGKVLTGLNKRIVKGLNGYSFNNIDNFHKAIEEIG